MDVVVYMLLFKCIVEIENDDDGEVVFVVVIDE